jgi:CheY-like chemotaxis protein
MLLLRKHCAGYRMDLRPAMKHRLRLRAYRRRRRNLRGPAFLSPTITPICVPISGVCSARFCEVETFADGDAAIRAIRRRAPDLVLADVMVPRLDGSELVRAIRRDALLANPPVILLSARAGEEAKVEGLASGADDYLIKPFNPRELIARISANLALAKLRQQAAANLQDMNRLQEVANQCIRAGDHFQECLDAILGTAIEITGANKGNIQLFDAGSNCLKIVSQKGFEIPFLSCFGSDGR